MDDRRFDHLTRAIAQGGSRRTLLKGCSVSAAWRAPGPFCVIPMPHAGAVRTTD